MDNLKTKRIGVLMGGLSREREVSLRSGKAVATALKSRGYQVIEIDVGRDIAERLVCEKIEVAFVILHGRYGEDGSVQGMLEILGIPYTGSGVLASAIGMDKDLTKRLVKPLGVMTANSVIVHKGDVEKGRVTAAPLPLPVVIKPNREGSTIGISIIRDAKDFQKALADAAQIDETVMIEEFVSGTEVTVSVLNGKALPVIEIVPKGGFYDYTSKYTKGMTEYIIPARISQSQAESVSKMSEAIFSHLQLSGFARMDFILSGDKAYFLEVNTIPGMTETSLVPKSASFAGISFEDLCEIILKGASLKI